MGQRSLSLNIDLGELPSESDELYELATIVNIACGGHAGDRETMRRACLLAKRSGALLAAHPSYPDRAHFGRRSLELDRAELQASLVEQMRALDAVAESVGIPIAFIKPHGALYHDATTSHDCASVLLMAASTLSSVEEHTVGFIGPGRGELYELATHRGSRYLREGFADRGLASDGSLIPRGLPGALLTDPNVAAEQALTLAESGAVETICVHGDTERAVAIARAVRQALAGRGLLR